MTHTARRFAIGAEIAPDGVDFRVWAPKRRRVEAVIEGGLAIPLERDERGYFSGFAEGIKAGARYRFRLDGDRSFPDPASRFQPDGPHGSSEVIDPSAFAWTDDAWTGCALAGQIIYEMHIGAFTREGTWQAARRELAELASVGITVLEIMPVADFPGKFGWGYDGVLWFAPVAIYGRPDDFRAFVDEAHRLGIGVILDVVYNHFGPDGNYLGEYSDHYFTRKYPNEWGEALNYDGPDSHGMRELAASNAAYWASEFHLDGLRLDATQQIFDNSPKNIMTEVAERMRAAAGPERKLFIVAENESQESRLARPVENGGLGLDGLWNDDVHHSARVALAGRREAYYTDYAGNPQEFISAAKYGFLYQGQHYKWQAKRRGQPTFGIEPWRFIAYIENHDQVANSCRAGRLLQMTSPARLRAATAYLLLMPGTPLLFQGQEFASTAPFHFFADHSGDLRQLVHEGRIQFLSQFPSLAQPEMRLCHLDPGDIATFERCKIDFSERERHAPLYRMHKDLIQLRRAETVLRAPMDGAVLGDGAFLLRFFGGAGNDRLLIVNLGADLPLAIAPEPLLAPPDGSLWAIQWSSEDPAYGGSGMANPDGPSSWRLPAESAVLMKPEEARPWA